MKDDLITPEQISEVTNWVKVDVDWKPKLLILDPSDPTQFKLRLTINQLMPDRTDYKPYSISYAPSLWVEVTVSLEMVVDFNNEYVVLTPDGIAHVADELATALDRMHDEFRGRDRRV
jgi:hypothetical protein